MKRILANIVVSGTVLLFGHFWIPLNLSVYAVDVRYIAFSSNRSGNYDIYMIDINGENLQNITNHPANDSAPTFSPDGQRMAYASSRGRRLGHLCDESQDKGIRAVDGSSRTGQGTRMVSRRTMDCI